MSAAQTPITFANGSTTLPYATVLQATSFHDINAWIQLFPDTGNVANTTDLGNVATDAGAKMFLCLSAASGEVEEHCFTGERYIPDDLAALEGNSAARLAEIVADLAFWRAMKRRYPSVKVADVSGAAEALAALDRLADGETIFGLVQTAEAGLPSLASTVPRGRRRVVNRARRMFGQVGRDEEREDW
jgi:hypothetical protein